MGLKASPLAIMNARNVLACIMVAAGRAQSPLLKSGIIHQTPEKTETVSHRRHVRVNKRKKVAWHKHLKALRKREEKQRQPGK